MDWLCRYSKDAPSSPWAERFPDETTLYESDNVNHSLLAPEYPRVNDAKYYDPGGPPDQQLIPLSYQEVDKFLAGEKVQRTKFYQLHTWQALIFRRYLQFSPRTGFISGGHRPADAKTTGLPFNSPQPLGLPSSLPTNLLSEEQKHFQVYMNERIQVNEANWFSFFGKWRWFDWIHSIPDSTEQPERTWTVDDSDVWNILRVSIELADRMLKALIHDKNEGVSRFTSATGFYHMDYFGPTPSPDASVLLSHHKEELISEFRGETSCQWDSILAYSPEDWAKRLEQLLGLVIWSFGYLDYAVDGCCGVAHIDDNNSRPYDALILLHIGWFETLLKSDLTLEERCSMQVGIAVTILHELGHAIIRCRYKNDNYAGNMLNPQRSGVTPPEPFIDGEGFRECGFYMEHEFFGGCQFRLRNDRFGIPLVIVSYEYPWCWASHDRVPDATYARDGHVGYVDHVPSTWISKMLSESFWQDLNFPRKSENFFHNNRIGRVKYTIQNMRPQYSVKLLLEDPDLLTHKYPEDRILVDDILETNRQWMNYREFWYQRTFKEWDSTPIARRMVGWVDDSSADTFKNDMPMIGKTRHYWVWYCIGLLMEASIPISLRSIHRYRGPPIKWNHQLMPSQEAAAAGNVDMIFVRANSFGEQNEASRPRAMFNNQVRGIHTDNFTQLDFVDLVDDILQMVVMDGAVVAPGFISAIANASQQLRADREALRASYSNASRARWASKWFFEFPEYDPKLYHLVNGNTVPFKP
ncbi:hypothetical protein NPX13_g1535 [Xylaria arbuscula]|uniref:Uncharacterized protein n=1 Tax=Xylaria arbuscula TaxID=114810 RepID=A0A9W8NMG5_9PEZI|nr:hypothetical protein NPX13_g1535 [Xylaria arbuscula]